MSIGTFRPACFEFAMDFLGDPEESEVRAYVERLERALEYIGVADPGGCELFPVWPSDTKYSEDGNTVVSHNGPWRFLYGKGATFLEAVEDQMRIDDEPPNVQVRRGPTTEGETK